MTVTPSMITGCISCAACPAVNLFQNRTMINLTEHHFCLLALLFELHYAELWTVGAELHSEIKKAFSALHNYNPS